MIRLVFRDKMRQVEILNLHECIEITIILEM